LGSLSSDEDLGHPFVVHGTSGNGKAYTMTTCPADIVWHVVEEQLQHFGELNALFWKLGIDPPVHAWFSSEMAWTHCYFENPNAKPIWEAISRVMSLSW
jgi:uncharacterized damage-inducible protein DinB